MIESFGRLTRRAEQRGVTLVLEPLTFLETTAVETLDDLAAVLDGVGSERAGGDAGYRPHQRHRARRWGATRSSISRPISTGWGRGCSTCTSTTITATSTRTCCRARAISTSSPAYAALKRADYAGWISAELMMFGANPVPPTPLELLRRTREHTLLGLGAAETSVHSDGPTPPDSSPGVHNREVTS